jgi:hypothetical protein
MLTGILKLKPAEAVMRNIVAPPRIARFLDGWLNRRQPLPVRQGWGELEIADAVRFPRWNMPFSFQCPNCFAPGMHDMPVRTRQALTAP